MDKRIQAIAIAVILLLCVLTAKLFLGHQFHSVEEFQTYIQSFGAAGPLVLTAFQAFQVVVPVLPGYLGCAVGAVSFGTLGGFLCNYIGISGGSLISSFLAKKYGIKIVRMMFSDRTYDKWSKKVEQSRSYDRFLFVATLLPLFPDDFLCYFSGLMKMDAKKFIWIIILGKPWCILAYSIAFGMIRYAVCSGWNPGIITGTAMLSAEPFRRRNAYPASCIVSVRSPARNFRSMCRTAGNIP